MNTIIGELGKSNKFVDLSNQIENKKSPISISGLTDVGMVELLSAINQYNKKPILLITYNEIQAKQILEIIENSEKEKAVLFPKKEIVTYDFVAESKDLPYERIETLNKIKDKKNLIVVTTIEALMQKLPPKEILFKNILEFKVGDIYNLEELKKTLVNLGYSRCEFIEGRGQFSVRGGIVDISINETLGVRIEFWGDEVDSIRNFNITSQRSINTLDKIKIYPAHEFVLDNSIDEICKKITKKLVEENQEETIKKDIEQIKSGNYISKIDKYFNEFYDKQSTLLEYLNDNYLIILDEISKIEARQRNILQDNSNLIKNLIEKEKIIPEALENIISIDLNQLENEKSVIYFEKQDIVTNRQAEKYTFNYRQINYYKSEIENLFEDIKR